MKIGLLENPDVPGPIKNIHKIYPSYGKNFHNMLGAIKESVKSYGLCHGDIHYTYAKFKMKNSPYLLFLLDTKDHIVGFACISFMFPNLMRLEVICSLPETSGIGTKLLRDVERIAALAHVNKIIVKSIRSAVGFYVKRGFTEEHNIKLPTANVKKDDNIPKYMLLSKEAGQHQTRKRRQIRSRRTLRASPKQGTKSSDL